MGTSLFKHVRRVALAGSALFLIAVALAAPADAAEAGGVTGRVATGGGAVNVRSGPTTSAKVLRTRPDGSRLVLLCQVKGQKIRGHSRTTALWNKVKGGGYVSDAYVAHGKVPPRCSAANGSSDAVPTVKQMHPFGVPDKQKSFVPTDEQMDNARAIVRTGRKLGLPARAWVIAVATSIQESTLHNYGHLGKRNDHDSLGLFQQRPSMGWGTPEQVTDPVYASTKFYNKLTRIKNWSELALTVAAQRVQVSGYPTAYRKWEKQAGEIVLALYGQGPLAR